MSKDLAQPTVNVPREWLLGGLLLLCCLSWFLLNPSSALVEALYSRRIYPFLSSLVVPLTSFLPFSLATVLLLSLPLLWLAFSIRSFQKRTSRGWLALWLWRTLVCLAILYGLFVIFWGANYRREAIEHLAHLPATSVIPSDVENLAKALQNILEETVNSQRNTARAAKAIKTSLEQTTFDLTGVTPTLPTFAKRLPGGWLILAGSASGVVSPWTLEAHVDGALPEVSYLAVGAHELAHIAGFAGEADADLVAAIAGLKAQDAFARYAVALRLWWDVVATFTPEDQKAYLEQLPKQALIDLESTFEPYRRYQLPNWIQSLQRSSYNQYLKTQGVEAGLADYSRIVNLLVKAQKQGLLE
jgi:Protein of unknown function (DUF3810)